MDTINLIVALLSIAFGGICLISPTYALEALGLTTDGKQDGKSELRAASGGAFVVLALAAIWLGEPLAWVMMGVHYAGAGLGRLVSFAFDGSGSAKMWFFFAVEAVFAGWLIGANWPAGLALL